MYAQSLIDTKNSVDLQDLIDGMNLSEEWGEENLDLEGTTDTEWLERYVYVLRQDGVQGMFIFVDPTPVPRREIWTDSVRNEQRRIGWKYPPEIYATRFRRRRSASKDPREMDRLGA